MQKALFYTLLTIVILTVITSLGAYIYNLIISPTEELVLVKYLLSSTVVAILALMIDIGRRWFISSKVTEGVNGILLDIIGAALVLNANGSQKVDNDLKELEEYYKEHILSDTGADGITTEELKEQIVKRVKKYKSLKFQVSDITDNVPQVRTPN